MMALKILQDKFGKGFFAYLFWIIIGFILGFIITKKMFCIC